MTFNIASILLGIIGMVFAVHSIQVKFCPICCNLSYGCTGLSIALQIWQLHLLSGIGDFSAVEDTVEARFFAAVVLLAVIVVLNGIAAVRFYRQKKCEHCG